MERLSDQERSAVTQNMTNVMRIVGLVFSGVLIFTAVSALVAGMLVVQLLSAAGSQFIEVIRYALVITLGSFVTNPALNMSSVAHPHDTEVAHSVLGLMSDFKLDLSTRGLWLPDASVARLLLAGTESPSLPMIIHDPTDVLDEHALLPIRMGGHFWHLIQQGTVHTVVSLIAMRAAWVFLNPALRRRQWVHVRNRPKVVFASWSCVLLSVVLLRYAAIAFGGWAALLALTGLVLHLDLYHTDVRLRVG